MKAAGGVPDAQRFHHSRGGPTVVPTNLTKTSAGVTIMKQPSHDEEEHGKKVSSNSMLFEIQYAFHVARFASRLKTIITQIKLVCLKDRKLELFTI